jgi:putative MATE family efflux protein
VQKSPYAALRDEPPQSPVPSSSPSAPDSHRALPSAQEFCTVKAIDKELIALAVPALGSLALDPVLSLIDTAFIGRLGTAAPLAGVGIASIVLSISFSIFNFLAIATIPLVAAALSSPDHPDPQSTPDSRADVASKVVSAGLFLAVSLGSLSGVLLFVSAPRLCRVLGASTAVLPHAVAYLRARAVVSPFVLASFVAGGAFRGFRDTKTPFKIALVANSANLILDPLLIFTCGLGAQGAAIATSVAQMIAFFLMMLLMIRSGRLRVYHLCRIPLLAEIAPLLRAGVALTIRTLSILGTVAYATATASSLGTASLAAFEVCRQLFVFHAMVLDSVAAAAQALVSSLLAQRAYVEARRVANRALQLGAMFGALIGAAGFLAGPALPGLFTRNLETRALTVACIRVAAVCTPLNGAVFALDGILSAARDYPFMAFAIACAGFAAIAALTAVRVAGCGVTAVWGALNVLMIARAAFLGLRYVSRSSPVPPLRYGLAKAADVPAPVSAPSSSTH